MFHIPVRKNARDYAERLVEGCNFGRRSTANGSKEQQFVGLLGQTVVHDLFGVARPRDLGRSDGGVDFEFRGVKIDVKTVGRSHNPLPEYANNVMLLQEATLADVLLFCSLNKTTQVLTVCGWLPKDALQRVGRLRPVGTQRTRSNGSVFTLRADIYEVLNRDLRPASSVSQMQKDLAALRPLNGLVEQTSAPR